MSVDNFKTSIHDYLETLPTVTFTRLFQNPATCLAIFRLLPSLGHQLVMSLLYVESAMLVQDVSCWVKKDCQRVLVDVLHKLSRLRILEQKEGVVEMNNTFRQEFKNALSGGGAQQSFGVPCVTPDKHPVDVAFLDNFAAHKWESILHYMVGTASTRRPASGVRNLLEKSKLMRPTEDDCHEITHRGFQFLLQDVNTQVWTFLLKYLDMAEMLQMDLVEVLNFLFQLGSLELGKSYLVENLTDTQRAMLTDLRDCGVVYQRRSESRRYYPTRLATTLTSGNAALATETSGNKSLKDISNRPGASDHKQSDQEYIILETNYKVYAYTDSPLRISILDLFIRLQCRFQNLVTGEISRESIHSALKKGITADQIISYLQTHAHPEMRKQNPVLPLTVVDQIRLWDLERKRLRPTRAYLYREFSIQADFDAAEKYARDLGALLWSSPNKRWMAISDEGHGPVRVFVKNRIQHRIDK